MKYDPVGNIICLKNDAEATRYWRVIRKLCLKNRYIYDSLYQLVSATGRESANQKHLLQCNLKPLPRWSKMDKVIPITRLYAYDRSGNLTQIVITPLLRNKVLPRYNHI